MKLYGTITSERASKGQGGNDFIHATISLNKETKEQLCIKITQNALNENKLMIWVSLYNPEKMSETIIYNHPYFRKDNKQKDENEYRCIKHAWHCEGEGAYPCPHH